MTGNKVMSFLTKEREAAKKRVAELEAAIRKHRDYRGDDRCYQDDGELYKVLPEGDTRPPREVAVTLMNCEAYIRCRQQGREYVSPQRRIEELEKALRKILAETHEGSLITGGIHDIAKEALG
jgi:hypothetical protein